MMQSVHLANSGADAASGTGADAEGAGALLRWHPMTSKVDSIEQKAAVTVSLFTVFVLLMAEPTLNNAVRELRLLLAVSRLRNNEEQ